MWRWHAHWQDPALQEVLLNLTTFCERIASGKRIGPIFIAIDTLFIEAHGDNDFWTWFSQDLFPYIRKLLLQPGYLLRPSDDTNSLSPGVPSAKSSGAAMSTEAEEDGHRVREVGFKFYGDRYFQQFSALREGVVDWIAGFIEDEVNDRLWEAWRTIWKDIFYSGGDEETGQGAELTFKKQMWAGVVKAIVPILVAQVRFVPCIGAVEP